MGRLVADAHLNALSRLKRQAAKQLPVLDQAGAEPEPPPPLAHCQESWGSNRTDPSRSAVTETQPVNEVRTDDH